MRVRKNVVHILFYYIILLLVHNKPKNILLTHQPGSSFPRVPSTICTLYYSVIQCDRGRSNCIIYKYVHVRILLLLLLLFTGHGVRLYVELLMLGAVIYYALILLYTCV